MTEPGQPGQPGELGGVDRREVSPEQTAAANRRWWDGAAPGYQQEHGRFLGDADFVWGPEGLREADAHLLGDVAGRRVLEIGAGAAQCARWLQDHGAQVVGLDISAGQLVQGQRIDAARAEAGHGGPAVPLLQADATDLPLADGSVDLACSAYGGVPFVADSARVMREVARVLRPGGRWVFSVTHPIRWALPDDPGQHGLTITSSYFDRTPYVEVDGRGEVSYAEHHRTLGDRVREISAAGLVLIDLVEPEWPPGNSQVWGGWSSLRGGLIPGTAIFSCVRPRAD
jgi:ubiquinone/menaquinone biosynthesis C-methylase UbiE